MFIIIRGQRAAEMAYEACLDTGNHIIISVACPGSEVNFKKDLNPYCLDILKINFDDCDNSNSELIEMKIEDANNIWEFIKKYENKIEGIIVHCLAGMSRSAAIAAAISEKYNGHDSNIFKTHTPNMHVYRMMINSMYNLKEKELIEV